MAGAFGLSAWAFVDLLARPEGARVYDVVLGTWIPPILLATANGISSFTVPWSLRLDPLSAVMLLVVTGIGSIIHVYATAYMKDEPRGAYARFFCYLNLFCFFMLVLVLAGNFLVLFAGWEGVGLCSYLLIGFWYEKTSAADAGKKAFLTNRIGDVGCLLGIFLVFFTFGTLDFREVAAAAAAMPRETGGFGVLSIVCLLLFAGAAGKSAQIPLHVWLPDAMEGPTPVSALIHAATMVTAGVYLVARNAILFEQAPLVMQIVAIVGALTALMAATIGLVQNDIKRVLAYSTVSQLGYMFLATGVGAFAAAVFHLITHAFFKALLFLGSGSVIHAVAGEQDMQRMGALKKHMPVTFVTMMVGTLAIAGIPPLAGFFSKDEILLHAFAHNRILWGIALATAGLTACYMFRLIALTFYGSYRGPAWSRVASPAAVAEAAAHGVPHPRDAHAHGQAERKGHEVTHGAADALAPASAVACARLGAASPELVGRRHRDDRRRARSERVARSARSTRRDDDGPDDPCGRDHHRRRHRHSTGARRDQHARALPGAELFGRGRPGRPSARRCRRRRRAVARSAVRPDAVLRSGGGRGPPDGAALLHHASRAPARARREVARAARPPRAQVRRGRALSFDRRPRHARGRPRPLVDRPARRGRRGQRRGGAHADRVVGVPHARQARRRRRGGPGGQDRRPRKLRHPPCPDGPGSELRAPDGGRRVRVSHGVLARQVMMSVFRSHLLSIILFTPLAGALVLLFVGRERAHTIRWIANAFAAAGFAVSLPLWFWYQPQGERWQFTERAEWIPSIGASYYLGVDGFSVLLILLTTLMGAIAILSSWTAVTERVKEYYVVLLVLQTGLIGAFVALDFLLFFLFWEVMLVPMYFLIGIWGGGRRLYSAIKFFLFTLVGSVVMLLGILALYFYAHSVSPTAAYTFDVTAFHELTVPATLQKWIFLAFFLGFAVKVPLFPLHTWLPDAHTDAPTAGSVILAAVMLKMGTYGFLRFSLPILPDATHAFVPLMVGLSIVGIIYGALVALAQSDWKRLVAYSSVSHMGMVMLGMFALTPVGITGSIVQQINHGISTGALFLIVGIVYERRRTTAISEYGGLSKAMPVFAAIFFVMTMSSIGLPALNGFIGEILILQGVYVVNKAWAAVAAAGIVLGAAYMLWLYQRTMFGRIDNPANASLKDLNAREVATFVPLVALAIWIGIYPSPILRRLESSVGRIVMRVNSVYAPAIARTVPGCGTRGAGRRSGRSAGNVADPAVHHRPRTCRAREAGRRRPLMPAGFSARTSTISCRRSC